jgi:homocysteine S-methyltransferase
MAPQILILDGGLGTSLIIRYGRIFDNTTPLWSSHLLLSDPGILLRCQRDFGEIPVDIITTATYQISIGGFARSITEEFPAGVKVSSIPEYLNHAVEIAETAKHRDAKVALSVGPYGACMQPGQEYTGNYDEGHNCAVTLQAWHQERLQLFASIPRLQERLGYLAFETIPRIDEIIAMRRSLSDVRHLANIPFWMSCMYPGDETSLPCGGSVHAAVEAMLDPKLASVTPCGIGINCTKLWKFDALVHDYEVAVSGLMERGQISSWPILVLYPDGTNGETWDAEAKEWTPSANAQSSDSWECQVAELVQATKLRGHWRQIVVGGCCMAHAEDIRRLRNLISTT